MVKPNIEESFPFAEVRDQQREAIEFVWDAFFVKKKKFVVLSLGTGCGKSPIGTCVSNLVDKHGRGSQFDRGTWYLTTQKVLQEQYMRDFSAGNVLMKTVKSSSNYSCQMFDRMSNSMSCAEVVRLKKAHKLFRDMYCVCDQSCRYRRDKSTFIESVNSLTNYSYFFAESQYRGEIQPRELLVLDEAHTIEEQLGKFVEITISERFARDKLSSHMPKNIKDAEQIFRWIERSYKKALVKKIEEVKNYINDHRNLDKKVDSIMDYARQLEVLDKHVCKINRFIKKFSADNWVMNVIEPNSSSLRKIVFKPVDVSCLSHEHLFCFGNRVLLMSATILNKDIFCRSLGIPLGDVEFLSLPSPFLAENRLVHYMPVGNMSKSSIDKTLPKMAEAVKVILDQHLHEKGIIHCVSFRVAKYIYDTVSSTRLLIHDSLNRDAILTQHYTSSEPTVLLSPSMMEGIDLHGDRSRFQVLCKVPFPYLGDQVVQKRMKKDDRWYAYQTACSVVQALGRSVRSESDYAVSYILDSGWESFFKRNKDLFSDEFVTLLR